jgi:hypothetical protein
MQIYDSILSVQDFEKCQQIIKDGQWRFTGKSTNDGTMFWFMDLIDNDWIAQHLFSVVQEKIGQRFELLRVYANGQTYGLNGDYHQDSSHDNEYTLILYVNSYTSADVDKIGGYTMFKLSNSSVQCIEPIKNRGVLFNSTIFHKGMAPNRYCSDLRTTIAFKMRVLD